MSADNFVVVRKFEDGYYWGNFSASYWWQDNMGVYPDEDFTDGPFPTEEAAEDDADQKLGIIEYGFEKDNKPS